MGYILQLSLKASNESEYEVKCDEFPYKYSATVQQTKGSGDYITISMDKENKILNRTSTDTPYGIASISGSC